MDPHMNAGFISPSMFGDSSFFSYFDFKRAYFSRIDGVAACFTAVGMFFVYVLTEELSPGLIMPLCRRMKFRFEVIGDACKLCIWRGLMELNYDCFTTG